MATNLTDEMRNRGRATANARRKLKNRAELMKEAVIAARDRGLSIEDVAKECHTSEAKVRAILFHGVHKAERVQRFNEALISRNAAGIRVIDEHLAKGDKDVAMWLLKETGAVGKEQTVINVNAQNAQINTMSNDTLDAARAVALLMQKSERPKRLQASSDIVGELVNSTEEQEPDSEHTRVNMGIDSQHEG